jgi:hypothetical protein
VTEILRIPAAIGAWQKGELETQMNEPLNLRIIVFHGDGHWIAQCLEHDICVKSADFDTLQSGMEAALRAEYNAPRDDGTHGLQGIPAGPQLFFRMWNERSIFNELGKSGGVSYEMALYIEDYIDDLTMAAPAAMVRPARKKRPRVIAA